MKHLRKFALLISLFSSFNLFAQFYVTGDDPGRLKWNSIESENYRIIYPKGLDSLAKVYGRNLEIYRIPLSRSIGHLPSGGFGKKMPVVLHPYNAVSNGSVAWAPKRMDLYTIPPASASEATPWVKQLAIHESRHVAQMQFGMTKALKPGNWFFGEMWNIFVSILYPGMVGLEGDAVIMETALTPSGRGRTAEFLNYYRVAFDQGDYRKWARWRYGSQKYYSPNYYALGYLTYGGVRWKWDNTDLMERFYDLAARKPYKIRPLRRIVKDIAGKGMEEAFQEICRDMHEHWAEDSLARCPFMPAVQVTKTPSRYTTYTNTILVKNNLYAYKSGLTNSGTLVQISPDGKEKTISRFSPQVGNMSYSDSLDRLVWSELVPNARWSLKASSNIRVKPMDSIKKRSLRNKTLFYNPCVDPATDRMLVAEYFVKGGSAVTIVDGRTGFTVKSYKAPDSLQVTEAVWLGKDIYALALSDNGFGIYLVEETGWKNSLSPQPISVRNLFEKESLLMFTCDRTGVNELYSFAPKTGDVYQITNSKYGATDYVYDAENEYLYYSSLRPMGRLIFKTSADSLYNKKVDFTDLYKYPIAEKLSEQELALGSGLRPEEEMVEVEFSEPKRYRKLSHLFNVHSWAPAYVNVDNIMRMSYDKVYDMVSLGATGIVQNRLSTFTGFFGYSAHKDPYDKEIWRHSAHGKFTYSGLYPVFELSIDFNDRAAIQYFVSEHTVDNKLQSTRQRYYKITSQKTERPYLRAQLSSYIPFNLSSGGWYRGIIPRLSYTFTNDSFDSEPYCFYQDREAGIIKYVEDNRVSRNRYMGTLLGTLRYYSVLSTPKSCVFPRWGIGAEIGGKIGLGSQRFFAPMAYIYFYGYVPGFVPQQGIKLSAMYQKRLQGNKSLNVGSTIVNILPRGLSQRSDVLSLLSQRNPDILKASIDYAIPVYIGDISIFKGLFYIKRLELTPHFDFMAAQMGYLFSAGATAALEFTSIFGVEWPFSMGLTYSYNDGSLFALPGTALNHHFVGPAFSISF